jgi:flagellar biosynthesis protein FlhA
MRAILTTGDAGQFVRATGEFVLGGNFLVGVVLFLTLFIVQFAVVTGGANRIAEVAARFTLDALPGKQMSIDADLSAGLITEEEARERRKRLELEADFYGAMDGAGEVRSRRCHHGFVGGHPLLYRWFARWRVAARRKLGDGS